MLVTPYELPIVFPIILYHVLYQILCFLYFSLLNSSPLSSSAFNQPGMKVINLTILYLSKYTVTFSSVTSVTIVMTVTSLGVPSENKLGNFNTTFQLLEFQVRSVSWYQGGTPALPPWLPTSTGFHWSTLYPLVNWAPFYWSLVIGSSQSCRESPLTYSSNKQLLTDYCILTGTLTCEAAYSFTIPCDPHF